MTKIKCLTTLIENKLKIFENEVFFGIKSGNKISYKENEIIVTILLEDNKIIMKRKSLEYEIYLEFVEKNNSTSKYFLNNNNLWLPLDTFTDKILVDDSNIRIEYELTLESTPTQFLFEIKYEVVE